MISSSVIGVRVAFAAALLAPAGGILAGSKALPSVPHSRASASTPAAGDEIIRAMHDRYAKTWYRTLSFTQKTTRRTPADTMVLETWRERAMIPGRLRIDVERATGNLAVVYAGDSLFTWRGDSTLTRTATRNILLVIGFDVYRQPPETTLAVLEAEHFPMTPVREDTWEGRPVYVIGAAAGDLHSHQLWIDRDRLLYVRSIQPDDRDTTQTLDMRFDNYVKVPAGWLSERVEIFRGGKLVQREEYSDVRTNVSVDPQIFSPPVGH
jgi:outer membrane lipoprotein-sorting protein